MNLWIISKRVGKIIRIQGVKGSGIRVKCSRIIESQILLSGDLGYIETGQLETLQKGIGEVERLLKALAKSLERKALEPLNP
jgi:hypothetical protein